MSIPQQTNQELFSEIREYILDQLSNARYLSLSQLKTPYYEYNKSLAFHVVLHSLIMDKSIELLIPLEKHAKRGHRSSHYCLSTQGNLPKNLRKWSDIYQDYL